VSADQHQVRADHDRISVDHDRANADDRVSVDHDRTNSDEDRVSVDQGRGRADRNRRRRRVRPSLLWLLLVPVLLVTGVGTAVALAAVTFAKVIEEAMDFGTAGNLPAGQVTVWVAEGDRPEWVRLIGPGDADLPLTPEGAPRTVTADGVRWRAAYTATIVEPGEHRVEATGGRAALRGPDQLDTATVRRNGIVLPLALATASVTLSILAAAAVLGLRSIGRRPIRGTS
jgi:hypothetical protein